MLQSLRMLTLFCAVLIISGCSSKLMLVPVACEIPNVNEPIIDTFDKNTTLEEAKRCAHNYFQMKEAYEVLKKSVEVCK
jgi:hypothetical protein